MRAGWIRPSVTSWCNAKRAISRRTGSNAESTIASGVSSTTISTPVAASKARMLRPSRPMMRPFISSDSIWNTVTEFSIAVSVATRWIDWITIRLASFISCQLGVVHNVVNIGSSLCFRFFFQRFNQAFFGLLGRKTGKSFQFFTFLHL